MNHYTNSKKHKGTTRRKPSPLAGEGDGRTCRPAGEGVSDTFTVNTVNAVPLLRPFERAPYPNPELP